MNIVSRFIWRTGFLFTLNWYYRVDVVNRKSFPKKGPVIVAANHQSNHDPIVIGHALPRQVHFMAKAELFKNLLLRPIIEWLGAFPVHRGGVDKVAIRHAMKLLKDNKVLGIFPEGTRQKEGHLGRFHDGVASMALRTGIGVVPVVVMGTTAFKRGHIACIIGERISVEKGKATPEAMEALNNKIRQAMENMIVDYKETHPHFYELDYKG